MKTTYKYILALSLPLMLASCAEDTMNTPGGSDEMLPICLSASYPTASRASDAGFEDGDNMGVYVLDYHNGTPQAIVDADIHAGNVRFGFDGANNIWNGATTVYWSSKDTPADIIGYYPYSSSIDDASAVPFSISRRQDQSGNETALGGYEASDFLWAKAEKAMPTTSRVDLTFRHLMAGIRVTLTEGSGFAEGEWAKLEKNVLISKVIPTASVNLADGSVKIGDDSPISVTPYEYNGEWLAVVVPQTVAPGNIIAVSVDGVSYNLPKDEGMTYLSGKRHAFKITVNKRSDSGKYEFKLTDEAITAWIDDVDFRDGLMRQYVTVNVPEKGTLSECLQSAGLDAAIVKNLKVTGEINEIDFTYMRDEMESLKSLNINDAEVYSDEIRGKIPEKAFYCKNSLSHIVFPKYLKIIGGDSFHRTGLLGDLIIPEGVEDIGTNFELDHFFSGSHANLSIGAFSFCEKLLGRLFLPNSLKRIEDCAFTSCQFEGGLILPDGLEYIGDYAFFNNSFNSELSIPESVTTIGPGAFGRNSFVGSLIIPESIEAIYNDTFEHAGFNGNLKLSNKLREIGRGAFKGTGFQGELLLPSTLKNISAYAFSSTKFSSVVMPNGLLTIGKGCFMDCSRLAGELSFPKNITVIEESTFAGCTLLERLSLHENITLIKGGAFKECYNLAAIECLNPTPPTFGYITLCDGYDTWGAPMKEWTEGPFYNVPLVNLTVEVPEQSVALYRNAKGWSEFSRLTAHADFECRPSKVCALNSKHVETLIVNSSEEWSISHKPSWCEISKTTGKGKSEIILSVGDLSKGGGNRTDSIVFTLKDSQYTAKCELRQYDYQYAEDECITLQKATRGNGIDVLFLGDGFDGEAISTGKYLDLVKEQMEAFFGVEPYTSYRDYFNVYACISLSQESGVNTANTWRNTRFTTLYTIDCYGNGHLQPDDADYVFDYAVSKSPLRADRMWQSLIIMSLNSDEYGSETTMTWDGSPIAICCRGDVYPMDTRGIIQHEACGHAFGKLAEERIVKNKYLSEGEKIYIDDKQWRGWYQNISLSGKMADVPWSHFIFDPRYSDKVDVFEGAYGKTRGVYRSEINSCMNYGIPYFNAISRQDIVRRILEYSGEGFSMEKFYAKDSDKWGSTGSSRAAMVDESQSYAASGTHHPVRIIKSNKY